MAENHYNHNFKRRTSSSQSILPGGVFSLSSRGRAYFAPFGSSLSSSSARTPMSLALLAHSLRNLTFRQASLLVSRAFAALLLHLLAPGIDSVSTNLPPKPNGNGSLSNYSASVPSKTGPDLFLSSNEHFYKRSVRLPSPLSANISDFRNTTKNSRRFSHFRCLGDDNNIDGRGERACIFENVCYDLSKKEWAYHVRPDTPRKPILFDSSRGLQYDFWHEGLGFIGLSGFTQGGTDWGPTIYQSQSPAVTSPANTLIMEKMHAIFHLAVHDDNLGHLLWEEMGALWYSMIRLNAYSTDLIAMHALAPLPDRPLNRKFRAAFFKAITPNDPVSLEPYLQTLASSSAAQNICFDQLMVGGNMLRFFQNRGWHNIGHEPLFYAYRNRILTTHNINPLSTPSTHRIVFTNKTETLKKAIDGGLQKNRGIANLAEIVAGVRAKYSTRSPGDGGVDVRVVEWQKLSMTEQLELMHSTTIFITPSGGVSTLLPFLPAGAHAIIIDYFERTGDPYYGATAGTSVSMEAPMWNHFPHVKKLYYQVWNASDFVSDIPGKSIEECDWRYEVSTIVDPLKLDLLIQAAFEDMEA
ncbi:hypothetical protein HK100_008257 [Physocladia obscura]|uniref:Glycosyltransferase 61 catalytic domain-containing protein n=1 Tax=Physocladia obscura TaxID=109957 RepID=A0AAD5TCR6_9FUNG|nr:hypothetical protein HK100_008257 [Physocladia obscura]